MKTKPLIVETLDFTKDHVKHEYTLRLVDGRYEIIKQFHNLMTNTTSAIVGMAKFLDRMTAVNVFYTLFNEEKPKEESDEDEEDD